MPNGLETRELSKTCHYESNHLDRSTHTIAYIYVCKHYIKDPVTINALKRFIQEKVIVETKIN